MVFSIASAYRLTPRDYSACKPLDNLGHLGTNNGNRKIAFVIDSSTSMLDNDFDGARLKAAIALNDMYLISKEKAKSGQTPDQLTVIDFNDIATVIYELGDPGKAADEVIASIMPGGGTFIGAGVKAAVDELSKPGSGETSGRSGIIILTDGADDPADRSATTIEEIKAAGEKGIRVSMGYMAIKGEEDPYPVEQNTGIHEAVDATGGTMNRVTTADDIAKFLLLAADKGLTNSDKNNQGDAIDILPGVTTSAKLKTDGPNVFKYKIWKDETITVNATALEKFAPLKLSLRDKASNTELKTAETNNDGVAILEFKGPSEMDLAIEVSSPVADAKGVFVVGLVSDVDCTSQPNTTISPTNQTAPPTMPPVIPSMTVLPSTTNWTIPSSTATSSVVMYTDAANVNTRRVSLGLVELILAALLAL